MFTLLSFLGEKNYDLIENGTKIVLQIKDFKILQLLSDRRTLQPQMPNFIYNILTAKQRHRRRRENARRENERIRQENARVRQENERLKREESERQEWERKESERKERERKERERKESERKERERKEKERNEMDNLKRQLANSQAESQRRNEEYLKAITTMNNQSAALENLKRSAERSERDLKADFERKFNAEKAESDKKMNSLKVNSLFEIIHSITDSNIVDFDIRELFSIRFG